jgi:hypothetical protein
MKILRHPSIIKYRPKVIVGGQGVWELIDSGLQEVLGIDCIVEGEGEVVAPELFIKVVTGLKGFVNNCKYFKILLSTIRYVYVSV